MQDILKFLDIEEGYYSQVPKLSERAWIELFLEDAHSRKDMITTKKSLLQEKQDSLQGLNELMDGYKKIPVSWNNRHGKSITLYLLEDTSLEITKKINDLKSEIQRIKDYGKPIKPGSITEEDIRKAKEVPIESLYTGTVRRNGNKLVGRCEFHNEKTGSFTIYLEDNRAHCFGCSWDGDSIDYICNRDSIEFIEAVKKLIT